MATQLISGQNILLECSDIQLLLHSNSLPSSIVLDTSAFLLNDQGKVRSDDDFVFFNAASRPSQGIDLDVKHHKLVIDLNKVDGGVKKIVLASTISDGVRKRQSYSDIGAIGVVVEQISTKKELARFDLDTKALNETALIFAEVYRHNGVWKFKAVGQGFAGGLEPLCKTYGLEIGQGEGEVSQQPEQPPIAKEAAAKKINLSKIVLEKQGQKIRLDKQPNEKLGKICINLNWDAKKGLFGGSNIDLDLGCLFEMLDTDEYDGYPGCVQALGDLFGEFDEEPYIVLDGDDRSGDSKNGENLYINGHHWDKISRVLVYAFIYEGAPSWAKANGVVTIQCPGQSDIEVKLDSHSRFQTMCAIAMLENRKNNIEITKLVEYFNNHSDMDDHYGFGLNWVAGQK